MPENTPQAYMSLALDLAQRGRNSVSPNPMVGCIIVQNNQIVGHGWHQQAGGPHAEVFALREAGEKARGATAYVTLEPCCHYGRTPPCTKALIEAGIKEVYAACLDANPLVAGKGVAALQQAGIEVHVGLMEAQAKQLNEIFFHYIKTKRPFVVSKWAMSLDGKTITEPTDSPQISGQESQKHTHDIRRAVDGILVGARTALADNPQLTARAEVGEAEVLRQPLRIVLSSEGNLPLDLKLVDGSLPGKTLIATTNKADLVWCQALQAKNIEVLILPQDQQGQVDLHALLDQLGQRGITSLLVEGGKQVHDSFFRENLVNKVQVYLAPNIIASLKNKRSLDGLAMSALGADFSFTANLQEIS